MRRSVPTLELTCQLGELWWTELICQLKEDAMRAVVFDRHGPPDVLRIAELPRPEPGPGQLRVRVHAAGVQPFDTMVRQGRLAAPIRFPQQLGNEFSGVVDRVGAGVRGWPAGIAVLGWAPMASQAEYAIAEATAVVEKPAEMPWDVAGGLGASGQTALTALRELRVTAGEILLVHAAAGGVGTMAVQLARLRGARVIGTASPANHPYLAELGAIPVRHGDGLVERVRSAAPDGVDVVLDAIGGDALLDSLKLVDDPSRIGTLVDHDVAADLGLLGIRAVRSTDQLRELARLWQAGSLRVSIRASFPLDRIIDAHRSVEYGHGRGKVVVTLDEGSG
jgi:NADPH:quinone reductase-like Zn-dependent oxidoreductase